MNVENAWNTNIKENYVHSPTAREASQPTICIVDDELLSRTVLEATLSGDFTCYCFSNGPEAIVWIISNSPDLIVLDMNMPEMDGLEVCRTLKANSATKEIPIIFATATLSIDVQNACWEAGAADFVLKPIVPSTLQHRVKHHIQNKLRIELLHELTYKDHLTKTYNRYYLSSELPSVMKQLSRDSAHLGVVILDIDHFKGYNDSYGHLMGDHCLRLVASALQSQLKRPSDKLIRYGGEEFLVLLPYADKAGCKKVAINMVTAVAELGLENSASKLNKITISAGYKSALYTNDVDFEELINTADLALFQAKEDGKNKAVGA